MRRGLALLAAAVSPALSWPALTASTAQNTYSFAARNHSSNVVSQSLASATP